MASIDWTSGKIVDTDQKRSTAVPTSNKNLKTMASTKGNTQRPFSLTPVKVRNDGYDDDLELRKLHPTISKEELMNDSPKRWDLLHNFDKTKKQTREFLRQALQEEMEYDPECTFQPQISEMSELIMRKYNRMDFTERNKMWTGKKQARMDKLKERHDEEKIYPFHPEIVTDPYQIRDAPQYKAGVVLTKTGVKGYLDKIAKQKLLKERNEYLKNTRKSPSPYRNQGPKVTVPIEQTLTLNAKLDNAFNAKFSDKYLSQLKAIEHKEFLESLKDKKNMIHMQGVTYQEAVNHLHDQLYNLNLEDYASKIKVKRRIY